MSGPAPVAAAQGLYRVPDVDLFTVFRRHLEAEPARRLCTRVTLERAGFATTPCRYADLWERVRGAAGALGTTGTGSGERVALCLDDPLHFLPWFLATLATGRVAVPLPAPGPHGGGAVARRIASACHDCAPRVVVVSNAEARGAVAAMAPHAEPLLAGDGDPAAASANLLAGSVLPPALDAPALLQYTSGSTGSPRGVVVTHGNLVANLEAIGVAARFTPSDVMLSWLPLHHDMGLVGGLLVPLYWRMETYVLSPLSFIGRPQSWMRAAHELRATATLAPTFALTLIHRHVRDVDLEGLDLSRLRVVFVGAEPIDPAVLRGFSERLAPHGLATTAPFPVYGLAELALAAAFPTPGEEPIYDTVDRDVLSHAGRAVAPAAGGRARTFVSEGTAVPGHCLRIVEPGTERELGEREVGEILLSGPSVSPRYFGAAPTSTRVELRTGDLGYIAGGRVYVVDRLKDLIVIAGQKYHPSDIEAAIDPLCDVKNARAVAFAVGGEHGTEALCIALEVSATARELAAELRERITRVVRAEIGISPREILLLPRGALPRTTSGKIQRGLCRRRYEEGAFREAATGANGPPGVVGSG
jgi:acyl-CoA synthetase (AMP-forming)/AMP-acid ligase II